MQDKRTSGSKSGGGCLIGPNMEVRGRLSGDEDLIVEGRVSGQIALSRALTIETAGVVEADVTAEELSVAGRLKGDVVAQGSVTIVAGATVEGKVRATRISIEEGARFKGAIDMDVDLPPGIEQQHGRR